MYALIDVGSFYVSAERLFAPQLRGRAVVVLSNNDACVVARSPEAKAIPVEMGAPLFEIRHLVDAGELVALSSNYTLYGDISARVMMVLADFGRRQEVYSIDECFLDITGEPDPMAAMVGARRQVLRDVGMPTAIGIAPTKTLAKLGSDLAKHRTDGVLWMPRPGPELAAVLADVPVGDVWGVGRRIGEALTAAGICSALDLARVSPTWMQRRFGVVGARLVLELRGERCLLLEAEPPPKQSLTCSRSFGAQVHALPELHAALATFVERAAAKARAAGLAASAMTVWIANNPFDPEAPACSGARTRTLMVPSNLTSELLGLATDMLRQIWRPGGRWKSAGVTLLGLVPADCQQMALFDPIDRKRGRDLATAVDAINQRFGREAVRQGSTSLSERWRPMASRCSPRYTTKWDEVLRVT